MSSRSSVWAAMYGDAEDEDTEQASQKRPQQVRESTTGRSGSVDRSELPWKQSKNTATNNRRFLSAQPPFATDDDTAHNPPTQSRSYRTTKTASEISNPNASTSTAEKPVNSSGGRAQRSREMFGADAGGLDVEAVVKRKKPRSAIPRHLYPTEEAGTDDTTTPKTTQKTDYGGANLNSDMADVGEFAFWKDVRRCETLLGALSGNLEICKEKMDGAVVATMAEELERVVGAVKEES